MRERLLTAAFLVLLLTVSLLGCSGTEPPDVPQEVSIQPDREVERPPEVKTPITERLADCLAEMFPQMSRDELERQAQMQMTEAGDVRNAESFVEKFCEDGEGASQLTPTDTAMPTSDIPGSTNPAEPDLARGLGVTRTEMEEFFRTEIAASRTQRAPVTFTVTHRAGGRKVTEAQWDGWGASSRRVRYGGKYVALAGPDEDLHGILFAYEGKPSGVANEFSAVAGKVGPEESPKRPKHALWVGQRVRGMTFGGGGGGGLPNIMPSSRSHSAPPSIEESCEIERNRFVKDGIEICVAGRSVGIHGIVIMVIKAPGDEAIAK